MDKITTRPIVSGVTWAVYLGKKRVGVIRKEAGGYYYQPDNAFSYRGDSFDSFDACLQSLKG